MPEPGELALGIAPRIPLSFDDGFVEGYLTAKMGQEAGHAVSPHGRQHGTEVSPT
jgi:hypothetical protein